MNHTLWIAAYHIRELIQLQPFSRLGELGELISRVRELLGGNPERNIDSQHNNMITLPLIFFSAHTQTREKADIQGYCRCVSVQHWLLHSKWKMNFSRPWISHVKNRSSAVYSSPLSEQAGRYCFLSYENLKDLLVLLKANKHLVLQWKKALEEAKGKHIARMKIHRLFMYFPLS